MTERGSARASKPAITIERTFTASPLELWEMWTTRDGLESWWGPDGFTSTVRALEFRVGGRLEIAMEATAPGPKAMLEAAGQPVINVNVHIFTEIEPPSRLAFTNRIAFLPGVEPYEVACSVDLEASPGGTRMIFTSDVMHDDRWTGLATAGWEGSFDRLGSVLNKNPK